MFRRLKHALVQSLVGAIGLGWLLAQAVIHCAYGVTAPLVNWAVRDLYCGLAGQSVTSVGLSFKEAIPELARGSLLLIVALLFLRWLYFQALPTNPTGAVVANPEDLS